jgi:hypothetical protein
MNLSNVEEAGSYVPASEYSAKERIQMSYVIVSLAFPWTLEGVDPPKLVEY